MLSSTLKMASAPILIKSIKEIYKHYDTFIFDMDGVLVYISYFIYQWQGDHTIVAGIEAANFLLDKDKQINFYTNNSTKSRSDYVNKLATFGINVEENNVPIQR